MNFDAVKDYFQPITRSELDELMRKHATGGEESISPEEVGIDREVREAASRQARKANE